MKTIIAATDFSPVALGAVNYAADMAVELKAELLLLNVYNLPVVYNDGPVITMPVEELREGSEKDLEKIKEYILFRTTGQISVNIKARMGNVTEELEDLARTIQPFAVVIGSRGKTNFEKTVFGSSTLSIIRHLTWPVICIPPGKEFGTGIHKIGFACDFKEVSATTPAETIKRIRKQFNAELHILNVGNNKKNFFKSGIPEESFILHQLFLEEKPQYHFIENPDVNDGINKFAKNNKLDLLITIPKRHKLLEKFFKPSSTKKIIAKSQVPVLCIHE